MASSASVVASSSPSSSLQHSWPPLLSWKGMQLWCVGTRAPSLCQMFVSSHNSSSLLGLLKLFKRRRRTATIPPVVAAAATTSKTSPSPRHSLSNNSPSSSSLIALSNCLRRHSDVASAHRLSTSSYERVSLEYHHSSLDLPRILKLGSSPLQSSMSGHSRADSSSGSSRFMGSPAVISSKLKGTCTRIIHAAQHNNPHITDLFTGNQFLLHVTAAPVSNAGSNEGVRPSFGLVDASLRCRDSELKDRIVFFL